jgi:hypothetical protein
VTTVTLSTSIRGVLPRGTHAAWQELVELRPPSAYLAGGTAIAAHLHHRVSRDLDFFSSEPIDMDSLYDSLEATGHFVASQVAPGTIIGVLGETRVQFLLADTQRNTELLTVVDGIPIAGLGDLLAMKLKVVTDRGELRDYFDIMTIEKRTPLTAEEGLGIFLERYRPKAPDEAVTVIVRALGSLGDVQDDPALPVKRSTIEKYWAKRQRDLVACLERGNFS